MSETQLPEPLESALRRAVDAVADETRGEGPNYSEHEYRDAIAAARLAISTLRAEIAAALDAEGMAASEREGAANWARIHAEARVRELETALLAVRNDKEYWRDRAQPERDAAIAQLNPDAAEAFGYVVVERDNGDLLVAALFQSRDRAEEIRQAWNRDFPHDRPHRVVPLYTRPERGRHLGYVGLDYEGGVVFGTYADLPEARAQVTEMNRMFSESAPHRVVAIYEVEG